MFGHRRSITYKGDFEKVTSSVADMLFPSRRRRSNQSAKEVSLYKATVEFAPAPERRATITNRLEVRNRCNINIGDLAHPHLLWGLILETQGEDLEVFSPFSPPTTNYHYERCHAHYNNLLFKYGSVLREKVGIGKVIWKLQAVGSCETNKQLHIVIICSPDVQQEVEEFFSQPDVREDCEPGSPDICLPVIILPVDRERLTAPENRLNLGKLPARKVYTELG